MQLIKSLDRLLSKTIYRCKKQDIFIHNNQLKFFKTTNELLAYLSFHPRLHTEITKSKKSIGSFNTLVSKYLVENEIESIRIENDLFATKETIELEEINETKHLVITKNKVNLKRNFLDVNISDKVENEILTEYKNHFEQLDEILKWIVACRFSSSRRTSFLHLNLNAGFGKTFFADILNELEASFVVDYIDWKSPSGLEESSLKNKLVIFIDEFKIFKNEFLKMNDKLTIEPKYKVKVTIPIYAKIFLSHEDSPSFSGAIDDQIIQRVNQIRVENKIMDELLIYSKNKVIYREVVKKYIFNFLKAEIDRYIKMNRIESDVIASKFLEEFFNKHNLKNKDSVVNIDGSFRNIILTDLFNKINSNRITDENESYINRENDICIPHFSKYIDSLLKENLADNELKKYQYKIPSLTKIIQVELNKNVKFNKQVLKCAIINKKYIINELAENEDILEEAREVKPINNAIFTKTEEELFNEMF
jgi:hypothetical protein